MFRDKTRLGMDRLFFDKDSNCTCNCGPPLCAGTTALSFEQTSVRSNDRSAFAGSMQQDAVVQLASMMISQAQNALEQTPSTTATHEAANIAGLATLIAAAKA